MAIINPIVLTKAVFYCINFLNLHNKKEGIVKILAILAVVVFFLLMANFAIQDCGTTVAEVIKAAKNPVDPSLDSIAINTMYQVQGNMVLIWTGILFSIPTGIWFFFLRKRK
jgi:type III secretory pathway component EscU